MHPIVTALPFDTYKQKINTTLLFIFIGSNYPKTQQNVAIILYFASLYYDK
jgi:hypothetical protein